MQKGQICIDVKDIIGKRSGRLKVIAYSGYSYSLTKGGIRLRHYYACRCDCGKHNIVERGPLISGITHSCGCLREVNRKRKQEVYKNGNTNEK